MFLVKSNTVVGTEIPDNCDEGLSSVIDVVNEGNVKTIKVDVDITHPFAGDLKMELTSPKGTKVVLHNRQGGNAPYAARTYSLEEFAGESTNGAWSLVVTDHAVRDSGKLNNWSIEMVAENVVKHRVEVGQEIPDDNVIGLESAIDIAEQGTVKDINLHLNITHPYIGDIVAKLIAPSGRACLVQRSEGANKDDLDKTFDATVLDNFLGEEAKGKWRLQVKDNAVRDTGTLDAWELSLTVETKDDLTKIEGIGAKTAEALQNAGINSFAQLADMEAAKVKETLVEAAKTFNRFDTTTWPQQARMAALGQWEALKAWQDELDGGKVVNN